MKPATSPLHPVPQRTDGRLPGSFTFRRNTWPTPAANNTIPPLYIILTSFHNLRGSLHHFVLLWFRLPDSPQVCSHKHSQTGKLPLHRLHLSLPPSEREVSASVGCPGCKPTPARLSAYSPPVPELLQRGCSQQRQPSVVWPDPARL